MQAESLYAGHFIKILRVARADIMHPESFYASPFISAFLALILSVLDPCMQDIRFKPRGEISAASHHAQCLQD